MSKNPEAPLVRKRGNKGALRWMARTIGGLLVGLILIVVVVVVLGIPIELNWVKGKVETVAAEALGRPFAIEGPLTLVPSMPPVAQIEGVRVGNPQGWPEAGLARLNLARVGLRIVPLLKGEVLIDEVTVDGLHVNLETNADGEPNWLLNASTGAPEPEPEPVEKGEPAALKFIELAELSLRNIVIQHHDAATGADFELELDEITGSAEDREPMQLLIQGAVIEAVMALGLDSRYYVLVRGWLSMQLAGDRSIATARGDDVPLDIRQRIDFLEGAIRAIDLE